MDKNRKKLLDELPTLGTWHHIIDLGDGIVTSKNLRAAYEPERRWKLIEPYIPKDLSGKSVLDLGCNSGYFSMKMKKQGAARVVAVDQFDNAIKQTTFISKWFNVELDIIQQDAHVYCLTTDERFDYVIYLGLFYHLKYGTLVLDRLAEMTKSKLFFETVIIGPTISKYEAKEMFTSDRKGMLTSNEYPKMFFIEKGMNKDHTNWWFPNNSAVFSLLRNARLKIIARPSRVVFVCEPDNPHGKKIYQKCVFPIYGKEKGRVFPL